ncbi:MAG: electron transfer flavoprotein subunit alpha/FixB family protein [Candidatus Thermoplasmatota archaeon]|nr:electron transfer flavoprotein subunit alpha/FixB family protein [Candidatus Thermoplasmatota archaeon]
MVLIYSDDKDTTKELIAKGRELADETGGQVTSVIIGEGGEEVANELIYHGSDEVILANADIEQFKAEEYTQVLSQLVEKTDSEIVLIGSDKSGKEIAPRLAAKLETGCVTDCIDLYFEDDTLTAERVAYSGNAVAVQNFISEPYIVTIPSKNFDPLSKDEGRKGEITREELEVIEAESKVIDVQEKESEGVNVEDAEIIVSCGRGFDNQEDLDLAEDLSEAFQGGTIGCSRPVAADLKWLPEDHWIGLSGHEVKPELYVAIGISGQIQHIAGMRDSGTVVAINKDEDAPIFDSADYGIVGDLYEVVPKLVEAINEEKR